jgi:hypothetical protein
MTNQTDQNDRTDLPRDDTEGHVQRNGEREGEAGSPSFSARTTDDVADDTEGHIRKFGEATGEGGDATERLTQGQATGDRDDTEGRDVPRY